MFYLILNFENSKNVYCKFSLFIYSINLILLIKTIEKAKEKIIINPNSLDSWNILIKDAQVKFNFNIELIL